MPKSEQERIESGIKNIDLNERLVAEEGTFYFSGITALVRLPLEQVRRDRSLGLETGVFITGYPGSPLAGYDLQLDRASSILAQHGIIHFPASSEERAATALMGTQMLDNFPHERFDGVVGLWYGKGPGVDRSGDALKHGNFAGTSRNGAVVILSGEDHEASSSTMPFQQDQAFIAAAMPIVAPSTVEEIYTLGLHAIALSRASRCWVALKLPTALCDSGSTFTVSRNRTQSLPDNGDSYSYRPDFTFFPGTTIEHERELHTGRHREAIRYARANELNYRIGAKAKARIGIVTTGKSFSDLRTAFRSLGIGIDTLDRLGIAVLIYGMPYPFDKELARDFARDVDQIYVIEEKRDLLETNLRAALHLWGDTTRVFGKHLADGSELFPVEGGFDADLILKLIGTPLLAETEFERPLFDALARIKKAESRSVPKMRGRTPNYCSGCPHSVSTQLPEGARAWGSPGCHSFASIIEAPRHIEAMTQYGGEGLPWIGLAPFTEQTHVYQNVGDGSLFHSSYPNIAMCVDAGVSITFKILFNGAIANTGGQRPVGQQSVASLIRRLIDDGVSKVALVTKEKRRYKGARFGSIVEISSPDEIIDVQKALSETSGVTVLVYDESCANERRRQQRRGQLPTSSRYIMINDRVCEACGDCGLKSNCMSLIEVPTNLGLKTQIHASSCNQDESCLWGDCPSFVSVETKPGTGYKRPRQQAPDGLLNEPDLPKTGDFGYSIYIPGLGGTGVITANAILATAASIDGLGVATYDQTGAAQKWGPVLSSLVLGSPEIDLSTAKVGLGSADAYLALDLVAAVDAKNLARCNEEFTIAVVNTDAMDTGEIVRNRRLSLDESAMLASIRSCTSNKRLVTIPARRIAESIVGDYLLTNMVVIGAAYQAGTIPISAKAIEAAIVANGVSVPENLLAFQWGRIWVADARSVRDALDIEGRLAIDEPLAHVGRIHDRQLRKLISQRRSLSRLPHQTVVSVTDKARDLVSYQNLKLAEAYLDHVATVHDSETRACPESLAVTEAVATYLHKLMAYKDEYEVARLYLSESFQRRVTATFESPVRVTYHLHPPVLRSLGVHRKLALGPWFRTPLRLLRLTRFLRGTPLDPFSYSQLRRQERQAVIWYMDLINAALNNLDPNTINLVVQMAELPEMIRGYEDIKLTALKEARQKGDELLMRLIELKSGRTDGAWS